MKHLTWTNVDKTSWGNGPWQDEPDKEQWQNAATGLPCLLKRNPETGALCGYVGIDPEHPMHGWDYDALPFDVHGGLTFSDGCQTGPPGETVYHIPEAGEPDNVWWIGFDCAHADDLMPGTVAILADLSPPMADRLGDETYRDVAFVKAECAMLAKQIAVHAA